MKLPLPATAAAPGAAQAPIDTPLTPAGSAALQRPRPALAARGSHLSAGGQP